MSDQPAPPTPQPDPGREALLQRDGTLQMAAEASQIAAPFVAPVVAVAADKLLNRPAKPEPPPQIEVSKGYRPKS